MLIWDASDFAKMRLDDVHFYGVAGQAPSFPMIILHAMQSAITGIIHITGGGACKISDN